MDDKPMVDKSFDRLMQICAEAAGIDLATCDQAMHEKVKCEALRFAPMGAEVHPWGKPREVESEIDGIISDIRSLRRRIKALDQYALSLARVESDRPEQDAALQALVEAGSDPDRQEAAVQKIVSVRKKPKEDWVDFAALRHLDELEKALNYPATKAIARADQAGKRRPRNLDAYDMALAAAYAYQNLTGKMPGRWTRGSTPFMRMVEQLYEVAGIKANVRKPIEAAIHKLRQ